MEGTEVKAQRKAEALDDELPGIIRTWGKWQQSQARRPESVTDSEYQASLQDKSVNCDKSQINDTGRKSVSICSPQSISAPPFGCVCEYLHIHTAPRSQ